jgi:hypothetical protein
MKNLIITLIITAVSSFFAPTSLTAQRPGHAPVPQHHRAHPVKMKKAKIAKKGTWAYLGKKTVNMTADRDEMLVTAYEGSFTSLKLSVAKSPVHIQYMEVVFANNEIKKFTIDKNYSEGSHIGFFDLPGNKRIIKKIIFQYQTIGNEKGKAKVQVWGKH